MDDNTKITTVVIHGNNWKLDDIRAEIAAAKKLTWTKTKWTSPKALVEINGSSIRLYTGQYYDPKYFELSDTAWTHDHCIICSCSISDNDPSEYNYTNGQNWVCSECHDQFLTQSVNL